MFQNNSITGFLFLVGIFFASPIVGMGASLGLITATLTATIFRFDKSLIEQGLFGYNAQLIGAALASFLIPNFFMWSLIIIGSIVSVFVMRFMKKISPLTFPFVIISWLLLIIAHSNRLPSSDNPTILNIINLEQYPIIIFKNISQVFLIESSLTGIIFLIAIGINSLWAMIFALVGAVTALVIAKLLGIEAALVLKGLFGFSAVLTAIALGTVFQKPSWRALFFVIIGVFLTIIIHLGMVQLFNHWNLPIFTAPFVFTTWIFLIFKAKLA